MPTTVKLQDLETLLAALPKAELHLHLEGAIEPATVVELAARHGVAATAEEVQARYHYRDFNGFLEAFRWVTSFLRTPADYRLITECLAERLLAQNVAYAEVTLSVGVMLRRKQDPAANFAAICAAGRNAHKKGLRLQWIFDAVRQFGPDAAMEVTRLAAQMKSEGVVAFGMGGDELALPVGNFRGVYDYAAEEGLHRLVHAGEVGGPEAVREAVEILGAERIGHGIAVMHDRDLMSRLVARQVVLELCPTSNLRTGALARQLGNDTARVEQHPLRMLLERGMRVTLSTDDPAMFHTSLLGEYGLCAQMGLSTPQLVRLVEMSFEAAFLPEQDKRSLLEAVRNKGQGPLGLV